MESRSISSVDYKRNLLNYNIAGCAIRQRDIFYFIAAEDYTKGEFFKKYKSAPDDEEIPRRIISFMRSKPAEQQWSHSGLQGFDGITGAVAFSPKEQFVVSCLEGAVFSIGSGSAGMEADVPGRGPILKGKTIGQHAFFCGLNRTLCRRDDNGKWTQLHKGINNKKNKDGGFRDFDGLTPDHIYAAGGEGDVWQFENNQWHECSFPSNISLNAVCASPSGKIYVSGTMGATFVGEKYTWKLVAEPGISIPFKDMVWYKDRVWCTNDYGVWWIMDDQLVQAELPGSVRLCAGYLSTRDGVLLLAGHGGAAFLENDQWTIIYHPGEMSN